MKLTLPSLQSVPDKEVRKRVHGAIKPLPGVMSVTLSENKIDTNEKKRKRESAESSSDPPRKLQKMAEEGSASERTKAQGTLPCTGDIYIKFGKEQQRHQRKKGKRSDGYTQFHLLKENKDTTDVLGLLAKLLRCQKR